MRNGIGDRVQIMLSELELRRQALERHKVMADARACMHVSSSPATP
jgi:hypothetical protein